MVAARAGPLGLVGRLHLCGGRRLAFGALQYQYRRGRQALLPGLAQSGGGGPGGWLCLAGGRQQAAAGKSHDFLDRSEEHTSELQSLMRISYAVFCLKKKKKKHISQYILLIMMS